MEPHAPLFTRHSAGPSEGEAPRESGKKPTFQREDGLTMDDFRPGDILAWDTIKGPQGGKVVVYAGGEKVVMTDAERCLPLADIIYCPSLKIVNR